jgi:hypothetical protein
MALERRTPLPIGRYWIDVFKREEFRAWLRTAAERVHVAATESFAANAGGPARDWYLFEVKAPVAWSAITFGFPDIAPPSITSSSDTVQRPPPERDPFASGGAIEDAAHAALDALPWVLSGVLAICGLRLATRIADLFNKKKG